MKEAESKNVPERHQSPDESSLVSSTVSNLAVTFLDDSLNKGRTISIPSLGLSISGKGARETENSSNESTR